MPPVAVRDEKSTTSSVHRSFPRLSRWSCESGDLWRGLESLESRVLLSASITDWYSLADHGPGVGPARLVIPNDGSFSEPRSSGVTKLEVNFNSAIDPDSFTAASVQITGKDTDELPLDLSGLTVVTSTHTEDTVGVVTLSQRLPDVARYLVRVVGVTDTQGQPLTGDTDRIFTVLAGDTSGDLRVSGVDLARIWAQRTDTVDPSDTAQVRADISQDGRVSGIDLARAWAHRNHQALSITDPLSTSETLANFLIQQMVPNNVFDSVWPGRQGLLLNSVIPDGESGLVLPRSWVYDNAASIIALTMAGRNAQAAQIIDALIQTAPLNGDLWFSVNVNDAGHADLVRTGANSWVGYAVNYHILARLAQNPNALNEDPILQGYLTFSQDLAQAVMSRQVKDVNDIRHGLVTGGVATIFYEIADGQLVEVFDPGERDWVSTEHNIDAYFFLRDLAYITGNMAYQQSADLIRTALVNGLYNASIGQFNRGVSPNGLDVHRALDTASWGSLFLLAAGEPGLAMTALNTTDLYRNVSNDVLGYKPGIVDRIYESDVLQQHVFPDEPNKSWDDISYIWSEGSLGVAMAYVRTGQIDKGHEILMSMLGPAMNVTGQGGIRYTDQNLPFQFHNKPSTIGTAWALMVQANVEGGLIPELFWAAQIDLPGGIIRLGQTGANQSAPIAVAYTPPLAGPTQERHGAHTAGLDRPGTAVTRRRLGADISASSIAPLNTKAPLAQTATTSVQRQIARRRTARSQIVTHAPPRTTGQTSLNQTPLLEGLTALDTFEFRLTLLPPSEST